MQRWEYRVVSLRDGTYTQTLNEYGQEGWELVSVVSEPPAAPAPGGESESGGMPLPIPNPFGRLEDAAAKLNKLGNREPAQEATPASVLLWVLRRPLDDD